MVAPVEDEDIRVVRLIDAQTKAIQLFDEITDRGLVRPGAGEKQLSDEIRDLAAEMFGTTKFWHKRIVRSGISRNTPPAEKMPSVQH